MERKEMKSHAKRVFVIAYYFPPSGGGGVQRIAKFVRYLPESGWLPSVLTVAASYYGRNRDASHVAEFPDGVEIIRTPQIDPEVPAVTARSANEGDPNGPRAPVEMPMTRLRSLAKRGRAIFWCARAVTAGLRAHKRQPLDLIFATGEPYSDFVIALILSRLTGVPFVIDMRDPWTLDPYQTEDSSALGRFVSRWAERRVLAACRACIFANRAIDRYAATFPKWKQKFHYIPNGYDDADFDNVEPRRFDKFTIVHNGNFLPGYRTADTFLLALSRVLDIQPKLLERIQVLFVGRLRQEEKLIQDLGLADIVKQTGYVPHLESIEYIKGADLLLLVGGRHVWEESAKVYEYLAAGKPILALVRPDGAAAELLRQYPAARIVDREDVSKASAALIDITSSGLVRTSVNVDASWVAQYDRKRLTEQLAQILDDCF